jgi:hypothetical protein
MKRPLLVLSLLAFAACDAQPPTQPEVSEESEFAAASQKGSWETISTEQIYGTGLDDWSCTTGLVVVDGLRVRRGTGYFGSPYAQKFNGKLPLEFAIGEDRSNPVEVHLGEVNVNFKSRYDAWQGPSGSPLFEKENRQHLVGTVSVNGSPTEVECYSYEWSDDGPTIGLNDSRWYHYFEIRLGDECRFVEWDARKSIFGTYTSGAC